VLGVAKDLKKFVHDDQQEWLYKRNVFRWSCKRIQKIKHTTLLTTWDLRFSTAMLLSSPLGCKALFLSVELLTIQMTTWPWSRKYNPSKCRKLHTQWQSITYQETWIFSLYYIFRIIHILEQVYVRKLPSMFDFNK
jgi:hypothetical protein